MSDDGVHGIVSGRGAGGHVRHRGHYGDAEARAQAVWTAAQPGGAWSPGLRAGRRRGCVRPPNLSRLSWVRMRIPPQAELCIPI